MRIKNTVKQIEQNKHDCAVNKENIQRLAQENARLEQQLEMLWAALLELSQNLPEDTKKADPRMSLLEKDLEA